MVSKPIDGKPASHANGGTIGFTMSNAQQVDAWHKAGVANGGTSIEDPPGMRQGAAGQMYLAYLRDPDGNKLCGLYRMPAA
jgi:predicted lactoylglutathione lyase